MLSTTTTSLFGYHLVIFSPSFFPALDGSSSFFPLAAFPTHRTLSFLLHFSIISSLFAAFNNNNNSNSLAFWRSSLLIFAPSFFSALHNFGSSFFPLTAFCNHRTQHFISPSFQVFSLLSSLLSTTITTTTASLFGYHLLIFPPSFFPALHNFGS